MSRGKRKTWKDESMREAMKAIRTGQMGYLKASKTFSVPKSTLERYCNKSRESSGPAGVLANSIGRKPVFPPELEKELAHYCLQMEARFYGLRICDIKNFAFELAQRSNLPHPFSKEKKSAGKKWLKGFLRRHSELSLRKPEDISNARARGFTPETVKGFFDIFEPEFEKIAMNPQRLYNVDETGLTIVQHKTSKVLAMKGKKQVNSLTSAERGKLMTVILSMSACGNYVPPFFIFPRKIKNSSLIFGAPPGSDYAVHPSGWVQGEIFTEWLEHFVKFVKPSEDDPVILILDGHYSHTRNIELIEKARKNNVIMICLPPHVSHRMQLLDVSFMAPLKTYYAHEIETWLRNHPSQPVPNTMICTLFSSAYQKAATIATATSGFRKTGLYPCDRNVFTELDYLVDATSPVHQIQSEEDIITSTRASLLQNVSSETETLILPSAGDALVPPLQGPESMAISRSEKSTAQCTAPTGSSTVQRDLTGSGPFILPTDVSPVPLLQGPKVTSRSGKSVVLTASPYKNELASKIKERGEKAKKKLVLGTKEKLVKGKKPQDSASTSKVPARKPKKKIEQVPESSSESDMDVPYNESDSDVSDENDVECMFCSVKFSEDVEGEKWAKCMKCSRWSHLDCGELRSKFFICAYCLNE